jgi:hypothetical protein
LWLHGHNKQLADGCDRPTRAGTSCLVVLGDKLDLTYALEANITCDIIPIGNV